ncbi:acyl-CoA dehydrogenase [Williamsia sp. Leaf354]|uniref:acyl-CoA dehydrogenase n=1 Tax=Williamsia sp. Leaf354 TaxID=1736349 RepID=UPI0006FE29A4|nr:acyl-CoA dehydrogenase [Williamsia sp. Leaf354]KQS00994.1 acyl-CoA dehydrogenase [Williamsia sp. Leaf354]
MAIADTSEHASFTDAVHRWAEHVDTVGLVRAEIDHTDPRGGTDTWTAVWSQIADLGLFAVTVPEHLDGLGATFVDLAVMLEQCGRDLVPGPLVATAVAADLLAGSDLGAALLTGDRSVALASAGVAPGAVVGAVLRDSAEGVLVDADAVRVVGASTDGLVLLAADGGERRWLVVDLAAPGVDLKTATALDGRAGVASLSLRGVAPVRVIETPAEVVAARLVAGLAAQASGITRWVLDTAVAYAKVRTQFGAPIGSFQAVKHLCAEMLCRSEQMTAAAWDVAHAVADGAAPDQLALSTAVAAAAAADLPVATAQDCIQVLGGIGFTFDHPAHLYLRAALSTRTVLGGSEAWRAHCADAALAGTRRRVDIDLSAVEDRRAEVRATCARITASADTRRVLAETGYLMPHWPAPYGLGAGAAEQILLDDELDRAGVTRPDIVIAGWAIPTILEHGTDAQRERFVAPTLAGDIVWCQLFSEPEAGSDLASLRTRATRTDGGWRLQGQKIWTSEAHTADWAICLARTDADAPKHKGISYFLVDMRSPGIDVRPLREITGNALFNEVFLDDVFVGDDCLVGEVNGGWRLARTTLANERVAMGGSGLGKEMESLLDQLDGGPPLSPVGRDTLGALCVDAQIGRVLDARSVLASIAGMDPGAISSVRKLIGARHRQAVPEFAVTALGQAGLAPSDAADLYLRNRCLTIAGGTSQVLATAAAERILGLPR